MAFEVNIILSRLLLAPYPKLSLCKLFQAIFQWVIIFF